MTGTPDVCLRLIWFEQRSKYETSLGLRLCACMVKQGLRYGPRSGLQLRYARNSQGEVSYDTGIYGRNGIHGTQLSTGSGFG